MTTPDVSDTFSEDFTGRCFIAGQEVPRSAYERHERLCAALTQKDGSLERVKEMCLEHTRDSYRPFIRRFAADVLRALSPPPSEPPTQGEVK